jgi:hypothetical protein
LKEIDMTYEDSQKHFEPPINLCTNTTKMTDKERITFVFFLWLILSKSVKIFPKQTPTVVPDDSLSGGDLRCILKTFGITRQQLDKWFALDQTQAQILSDFISKVVDPLLDPTRGDGPYPGGDACRRLDYILFALFP